MLRRLIISYPLRPEFSAFRRLVRNLLMFGYGFVMGFADEWGSVYLPEIEPYILSIQRGEELYELFPPIDYKWEDD